MDKAKKKKIIIISSVAVVLVAVLVVVLLNVLKKEEAYRIVKVYDIKGEAIVTREGIGEMEAYNNMVLESGDVVLLKSGTMTLKLDDDKYMYVESNTEFRLVATGSAADSKTSIELNYGAVTSDIQNALNEDSSYEVNTPNSNMAVRGTVFRVYTYYEDDVRYTKVSVFDGKVDSELVYADGSTSKDGVRVDNGNEVLIYDDKDKTDYVGEPKDIDFSELPEEVIVTLMSIVENGTDIGITYDELNELLQDVSTGPFTVTFMYNGAVFGTQTVEKGQCATIPSLMPAPSGSWDFDFTTEIHMDTTIEWR
ncbi:MAG: FecR domain-containing protein [Lachnospiraceae bacterium]|nr:FecR domain-containing protein [Lachnospiraceae bacterium]